MIKLEIEFIQRELINYKNDTFIYFWCPKKIMGYGMDTIPYWFLKEKLEEAVEKGWQ